VIRRLVPWTVLPLALLASALASAPWWRAFPAAVISTPLLGAAALSVLVAFVLARLTGAALWLTALIDLAAFVPYTLVVVLHEPTGFGDLVEGLVDGPAQVLTFALPLVSPRTLLVAPVALCWLAGAIAGECIARQWFTVLPYGAWLVTFGLSYAGSVRAATGSVQGVRVSDTLLALALLLVLLLLRVAQSWVRLEAGAQSTEAEGLLPLSGLLIGTGTTLAVGLIAAVAVQSSTFAGRTTTPQRVPSVDKSQPLSPVAFIAGLRPGKPGDPAQPVFRVTVDRSSPAYFGLANVDYYDGDGWAFTRSFRPSGGILPAEDDPALRGRGPEVTQRYRIAAGPLTSAPWMPSVDRPQQVTGATVNIDAASGMVVPSSTLRGGQSYTVRSEAPTTPFAELPAAALPATSAPPIDTQIPGALRAALATTVNSFADETGTPTNQPVPFLQALAKDLQSRYALAGPPPTPSTGPKPSPRPSRAAASHRTRPGRVPAVTPSAQRRAGGVSFADVLASIIGPQRSATPEQYATLFALLARQLGVPARVVSGFRAHPRPGAQSLAPGAYDITTADAWTWTEIPIRGSGWLVVDPAPSSVSDAQHSPSARAQPSHTPSSTPTRNALITQSNGGHAVAGRSTVPHRHASSNRALTVALWTALALLVLGLCVVLSLRKRLRARRRHHAVDPRHRLLGAWHESLDVLAESGLPDLTYLTSSEIALATAARFGPETASHAAYLGRAANAVIYSSSAMVGPAAADAAWLSHATLRQLVRRRLGVSGRLAAGLRYHRPKAPRATAAPASWAAPAAGSPGRRRGARPGGRAAGHRAH
jgi:transglutaminase-like putative cysteine protease